MDTNIEIGLVEYLLSQSSFTNLVGTRLIPLNPKQGTVTEYVVYKQVGHRPIRHLKGRSDLFETNISLCIYGYSYTNIVAIAGVITNLIEAVPSMMGDYPVRFAKILDFSNEDEAGRLFSGEEKLLIERELIAVIWHRSKP